MIWLVQDLDVYLVRFYENILWEYLRLDDKNLEKPGGIGISSSIYLVQSVELTLVINSSYGFYEILEKFILLTFVFRHMSTKILNFISWERTLDIRLF